MCSRWASFSKRPPKHKQEEKLLKRWALFLKAQYCHLTREYKNAYSILATSPNAEGLKTNHLNTYPYRLPHWYNVSWQGYRIDAAILCVHDFVLFSLLSRPRAGLATVLSSFFGLATNTLNVRNNNKQQQWSGSFPFSALGPQISIAHGIRSVTLAHD